jgi:NAD(P)-dependent dehydrogenase (short-subunit alcohol dehydrogenase family)
MADRRAFVGLPQIYCACHMNSLRNRVVLITGGGAGIGRAAAVRFAEAGARVVITGRRPEPLRSFAENLDSVDFVVADAADPQDASRTIDTVIERWGRLDVLVNNAGAGAILPLEAATSMAITQIFAVNVFGPSLLVTAALRHLSASSGNIVNVSSTYGHKAAAALSHYAASKAALEHMTRCWALELASQGIRVNAVAAGPTETEFVKERMGLSDEEVESVKAQERSRIPLERRGLPDEVAAWIVSLASDSGSWITGQVITVDGGLSIA